MCVEEQVKKEVYEAVKELSNQTGLSVWNYVEQAYRHYQKVVGQGEYRKTITERIRNLKTHSSRYS